MDPRHGDGGAESVALLAGDGPRRCCAAASPRRRLPHRHRCVGRPPRDTRTRPAGHALEPSRRLAAAACYPQRLQGRYTHGCPAARRLAGDAAFPLHGSGPCRSRAVASAAPAGGCTQPTHPSATAAVRVRRHRGLRHRGCERAGSWSLREALAAALPGPAQRSRASRRGPAHRGARPPSAPVLPRACRRAGHASSRAFSVGPARPPLPLPRPPRRALQACPVAGVAGDVVWAPPGPAGPRRTPPPQEASASETRGAGCPAGHAQRRRLELEAVPYPLDADPSSCPASAPRTTSRTTSAA